MNKCICFKHPTDIPKEYTKRVMSPIFERVKKGDTFTYVMNYGDVTLVKVELYDVNSGRHLFSIAVKSFEKFFVDLNLYRDKQIDKIIDGFV